MKALSIRQPWASLLVDGVKLYEYRQSDYTYRGLVAIHASKTRGPLERWALTQPDVLMHLPPVEELPSGCVIAIAWLGGTFRLTERGAREIRRDYPGEKIWGNPVRTQFALAFVAMRRLCEPAPVSGALSLWDWRVSARLKPEVDQISRELSAGRA
jgi:hypothetical protein